MYTDGTKRNNLRRTRGIVCCSSSRAKRTTPVTNSLVPTNTRQVADYDYLFVRPDAKMDGSKPSESMRKIPCLCGSSAGVGP